MHHADVRRLSLIILLVMVALPALAVERWQTLPLPHAPPAAERSGQLNGSVSTRAKAPFSSNFIARGIGQDNRARRFYTLERY
jgi:hypothetical protein